MRVDIKDKEIFTEIFNKKYSQSLNTINGISIDSRNIKPNDLFIPIKGSSIDGHQFIDDVLKINGTICLNEKTNIDNKRIIKTSSNRRAIMNIASLWREKIKSDIIAVTGSNGKTTFKELIYQIIKSQFTCSKSGGNHNSTIGLPLTFLSCKIDDEYTILELGASKAGEIGELCKVIRPKYSLITNISNAHIGNFGSIEDITECKSDIFKYLDNNGIAFINANDQRISDIDIKVNKITFGINNNESDYNGEILNNNKISINGFILKIPDNIYHLRETILAAYAVCNTIGIANSTFQESINTFNIPDGRGKIIDFTNYQIIDDSYNASPASMRFGINRLSNMNVKNKKILIMGDMLELGKHAIQEHKNLGEFINSKNIDIILTVGNNMSYLHDTLNENYQIKKHFLNIIELKKELFKSIVEKNDVILIKGSRTMKLEGIYN